MTCFLTTREAVRDLVLQVLRTKIGFSWITEDTRFESDLRMDGLARRLLFTPVAQKVAEAECSTQTLKRDSFQSAEMVREVVDAVWKSVRN